jgi:peroxiredoxin family protein
MEVVMAGEKNRYQFICSRGTLDGAYPSLVLALNSVRLGHEATVFFTFFGLEVIKNGGAEKLKFYPPGPLGAIPGMPQMASSMMRKQVEQANIPDIPTMIELCMLEGVKFVACHMTMEMMKIKKEELLDGVTVMTAEEFLKEAAECRINMFT